jgi:2-methylcitrate dehydratase PrpD
VPSPGAPSPGAPAADLAARLAGWSVALPVTPGDRRLADRSLRDTLAVAAAARGHPQAPLAGSLGEAGRLATLAHLIDYDDLHVPSTTHISAVCVAAALAAGGGARAYLAGAGVMARLGVMLGWRHYDAGWHATCTAGAPGAAVAAAVALGLDARATEVTIALAVPAAGGVNRAFGSSAKSLQVGFVADAGVRAARLAAAGADADGGALGQWMGLVGGLVGDGITEWPDTPAIPDGLAVKAYPCCYALQRPIAAVLDALAEGAGGGLPPAEVERVTVRAPADTVRPLIHPRPRTGLEGKFSLEYGVAAAILDGSPGLISFGDAAVRRPEARHIAQRVRLQTTPGGGHLLAGSVQVEVRLAGGRVLTAEVTTPPGAPGRPLDDAALAAKARDCAGPEDAADIMSVGWDGARALAGRWCPGVTAGAARQADGTVR